MRRERPTQPSRSRTPRPTRSPSTITPSPPSKATSKTSSSPDRQRTFKAKGEMGAATRSGRSLAGPFVVPEPDIDRRDDEQGQRRRGGEAEGERDREALKDRIGQDEGRADHRCRRRQ